MTMDMYGGRHSAATPQAITHFEAAVSELLGHRRQLALHLDAALAADPDHVASLALKGFGAVLLARSEQVATAQAIASHERSTPPHGVCGASPQTSCRLAWRSRRAKSCS